MNLEFQIQNDHSLLDLTRPRSTSFRQKLFNQEDARTSYTESRRAGEPSQVFDYDPIENDADSIAAEAPSRWTVSHFNFYRRVWEYVIYFVSFTVLWEVSFIAIFYPEITILQYSPFFIFDLLEIIDIFVLTHTSFLENGVSITKRRSIIMHYGRLRFAFHIISSIPLSWIGIVFHHRWLFLTLSIPKLFRVFRAISAAHTISDMLVYSSFFSKLFPVFIFIYNMVHLFACLFYLAAYFEGFENSWIYKLNWEYLDSPPKYYILSVYFVLTTILAIGFGDMSPQTTNEVILVIFIQLIGVMSNAFLVSRMVSALIDSHAQTFVEKFDSFTDFMNFKKISQKLISKVTYYFTMDYEKNHGTPDPEEVSKYIPQTIRNRLKADMCQKYIKKVSYFSMASQRLVLSMVNIAERISFTPGDLVFSEGDLDTTLYLLTSGVVNVYTGNILFSTNSCDGGQLFGEQELIIDRPRAMTIKAITHVSGWTIAREDMQLALAAVKELKAEFLFLIKRVMPSNYKDARRLLASHILHEIQGESSSDSDSDRGNLKIQKDVSYDRYELI